MQQNLSVSITCPSCNKPAHYSLPDILGLASAGDLVAGFTSPLHAIMPGGDFVAAVVGWQPPVRAVPPPPKPEPTVQAQIEQILAQPQTYLLTCPSDQKQFQATLHAVNGAIEVSQSEAVTPINAALYETGKQILTNSLSVASSFCTAMVTVSTGAVAIYTGLFALVLPQNFYLGFPTDLVAVIPALGLLAAALCFARGAYPRLEQMTLSNPNSIRAYRNATLKARADFTFWGFVLLCLSIIVAFGMIAWIAGSHSSLPPGVPPSGTPTPTATP